MKKVTPHKSGRPPATPILRKDIEDAQLHTKSNAQAARWLGVPYARYKQYAQLYGLFERHLNVRGVGIDKGFSKRPTSIPLRDILAGKHPEYSLSKLKNRLIARKKLPELCNLCGFHEARITDGRIPLLLTFKDGVRTNMTLENLELLCYNCAFLTTGTPSVTYRKGIKKSFEGKPAHLQLDPKTPDGYEREDDPQDSMEWDVTLTDEERAALLHEMEHDDTPQSHEGVTNEWIND